ncbi:MAG: ATP-grasp domain-containing protein [Terriglobales bacterium]
MSRTLNVLVLGVGGNVSQGILKALAVSKLSCRIIGACINPLSFGLYTVDQAYVSPPAGDPHFLDWLIRVCQTERVDAILSGVEPVLTALTGAAERIRAQTGAVCIVSSSDCLAIGNDKLLTSQWLRDHGFPFPKTADTADSPGVDAVVRDCGYPLIAKPRYGKGAHGVVEVLSDGEMQAARTKKDYVIQEYLGDPHQEYTIGCFSDRDSIVRGALVMRRELLEGTTYRAEAGHFPEVREQAIRIAQALRPMGPSNIQMRRHRGRAVCFEINVRFSGTTPVRARLGFNDVEAALRHYILAEPSADLPLITQGIVLRYWNEAYVNAEAKAQLDDRGRLDQPKRHKPVIEDYGMEE